MAKKKPFNKTKRFQRLRDKWYRKLEREGFQDCEYMDEETGEPKTHVMRDTASAWPSRWRADKAEYYRLAGHYLHAGQFQSDFDKWLWAQHAEGKSYREISNDLKGIKEFPSFSHTRVGQRILEIKKQFLILIKNYGNCEAWEDTTCEGREC